MLSRKDDSIVFITSLLTSFGSCISLFSRLRADAKSFVQSTLSGPYLTLASIDCMFDRTFDMRSSAASNEVPEPPLLLFLLLHENRPDTKPRFCDRHCSWLFR
jgi:hypothetical protein